MHIESNLSEKIVKIVGILNNDTVAQEKAIRMAALDAVALVQTRIQQSGEGINGSLSSKATTKFGAYSHGYGKYYRNRRGFQTTRIDWTVDGDLFRAWQILRVSTAEAEIGFNDPKMAQLAVWLEEKNGEAFGLNSTEQKIVSESFISEYRRQSELL